MRPQRGRAWAAGLAVVVGLAATLAWAQQSSESSRPVRGTGEAGKPSSGVLTIQGIFQGHPLTLDLHHTAGMLHLSSLEHISSVLHVTLGQSPRVTTFWVTRCGTTARTAITASLDPRRRDLWLYNAGTEPILIGGTHATVTATTGFTLHTGTGATSFLTLPDFHGRIDCITGATDSILQIIEVWR